MTAVPSANATQHASFAVLLVYSMVSSITKCRIGKGFGGEPPFFAEQSPDHLASESVKPEKITTKRPACSSRRWDRRTDSPIAAPPLRRHRLLAGGTILAAISRNRDTVSGGSRTVPRRFE